MDGRQLSEHNAIRYNYAYNWGMGGITFCQFIVLTITGLLLMFYYHPTKVQAFPDILYLGMELLTP